MNPGPVVVGDTGIEPVTPTVSRQTPPSGRDCADTPDHQNSLQVKVFMPFRTLSCRAVPRRSC